MMSWIKKYENLEEPSSFSGAANVLKCAKNGLIPGAPKTFKEIARDLKQLDSYALHTPIVRKFERAKIQVFGIDELWQADLVDLRALSARNKNYNYLLTVIDVLSKFAWVRPLKKKDAASVSAEFRTIFESSLRSPEKLVTDFGTEFNNQTFKKLMKEYDVDLIFSQSDKKACVVERFNRTLKSRMWRYFSSTGYFHYISQLEDFVRNYNSTSHSSIKMAPKDVNISNYKDAWENLYQKKWPGEIKKLN